MKIITILITLLLVMGFVTGFMGFFGGLAIQYGTTIPEDFSAMNMTSTMAGNLNSDIDSIQSKVDESQNKSSDSIFGGASAPLGLVSGAFDAGMMVLNAPGYFVAIINDLSTAAGLPNWVGTMLIGIVSIIIIGAIIQFITSREVS